MAIRCSPECWVTVVGHYNAKENVYPRKERPENKIDSAIALIMALGRYMQFLSRN